MVISKSELLDGFVIVYKDVQKAFVKVRAELELFLTALTGVSGKVLRILEMLNKRTEFTIIEAPAQISD